MLSNFYNCLVINESCLSLRRLFINSQGDFSDRGWEFGNSTQTLDTVLRKLYYVRYGKPDDDTFVKIGALDNVSLATV